MGLAKNVSPMTISVPNQLKEKMGAMKGVNWSAIASTAFMDVVEGDSTHQKLILLEKEVVSLRETIKNIGRLIPSSLLPSY